MEVGRSLSIPICLLAAILLAPVAPVSGQITTACTASLISSFTPCLNFITGSINGGSSSPTSDCCGALGSLINSGTDCACLILTGNVPFSLPINRTLAISLPRICGSKSVPLRCQGTAMTLPAPGPTALGPSLPPLPPFTAQPPSPPSSLEPASLPPSSPPEPASPPSVPSDQGFNQGQRPFVLPSSAVKLSQIHSQLVLPMAAVGIVLLRVF